MLILHVVGTRPNFMKAAPVIREMGKYPDQIGQLLVHTGQHYDKAMSEIFFQELSLPRPDIFLEVGSGSHAQQTSRIMMAFEPGLSVYRPDWVFVFGDVNSTLACALVAAKMGIKVAHVEAGLRSFDRSMPEEINRLLTDQISDIHFVSEPSGRVNLLREGCNERNIHFVGNVMIDTLLYCREWAEKATVLDRLRIESGKYGVLTLHRPSNVDSPQVIRDILYAVREASHYLPIVFPAHPRTQEIIRKAALQQSFAPLSEKTTTKPLEKGLYLVEPMGYLDFSKLISHAKLVMTDSGGIQEETTILQVPCLTLRNNTERPVTVSKGTNTIVGVDPERITREFHRIRVKGCKVGEIPEYWDGNAAKRIVEVMLREGGLEK